MMVKDLQYRRQFLLSPKDVQVSKNWKTVEVTNNQFVTIHPDLNFYKAEDKNNTLVLLGYILDPYHTDLGDQEIVNSLLKTSSDINDLFESVAVMGGRYVVIANINGESIIFNDSVGYRQVYYHTDDKGKIWCASQPGRIGDAIGKTENNEISNELNKIDLFKNTSEYWLPGRLTTYKDIFHLLPNHYFDFNKKKVYRFWPRTKYNPISISEIAKDSSNLMQGILESAANRFDIACSLTAGADTRVILAASRNIVEKMHFFTHTHPKLDENGLDILIPKRILGDIGLKHHVVKYDDKMDDSFKVPFYRNTQMPRLFKGINAYTIYKYFTHINNEMLVCNGEIGGIAKRFYRMPYFLPLNGKVLSILTLMQGSKNIEESFEHWLESARIAEEYGIHILDLLYIEGRMASWSAMTTCEYDIAFDSLSPFNCRKIIQNILYAPKKYRKSGAYYIHNSLIQHMWPELQKYPVNPSVGSIDFIRKKLDYSSLNVLRKFVKLTYKYLFS